MGTADARRGTRRSNRPTQRPRVRRRAEVSITTRDGLCAITAGFDAGQDARRDELAGIGVRVPPGRSRLVVTIVARGRWYVHDTAFKRVTVGASADPYIHGVNFCWLPREFRNQRVEIACRRAPSKRRASAKGRPRPLHPRREQPHAR